MHKLIIYTLYFIYSLAYNCKIVYNISRFLRFVVQNYKKYIFAELVLHKYTFYANINAYFPRENAYRRYNYE